MVICSAVLLVFDVSTSHVYSVKSDGQDVPVTNDRAETGGWGISHAYAPSGTNSLSYKCSNGSALFHGSRSFSFRLANLTADHNGYVFMVTDTTSNWSTITKNGVNITSNVLSTLISQDGGWGMSYAAIPVEIGDELAFTSSNAYAIIY